MELIQGTFCSAKIFATSVEDYARTQIKNILDNPISKESSVCLMPDCHPGTIAPIGLSMTIHQRIIPNLLGIDVGCGVTAARITKHRGLEFKQVDSVIRDNIPSGFDIRKKPHRFALDFDFTKLNCTKHISKDRNILGLGTLGGGNHFIEIDKSQDEEIYLVVHSGSRHFGKELTDHYLLNASRKLRPQGIPYEWTFLENDEMNFYIDDLQVAQEYARLNRLAIIDDICKGMKWKYEIDVDCCHNFIEKFDDKIILRKGSISAKKDEKLIIPINMKDGIILGKGLGNAEWNFSAPHGSGRIMKRDDVKKSFTVSSFKKSMKGIYSSCIDETTLDEAPFAYRGIDEIKNVISDSVEITKIIKPIYNFKAGGN